MGRPPFEITPQTCQKAEALASQGLTMNQIANVLGMGRTTFFEKKAEFADFADSIKRGQDVGVSNVVNALYQSAQGETITEEKLVGNKVIKMSRKLPANPTSCIFFLKNRAGWKDKQEFTGEIKFTKIERVIVEAPKPKTLEQYVSNSSN